MMLSFASIPIQMSVNLKLSTSCIKSVVVYFPGTIWQTQKSQLQKKRKLNIEITTEHAMARIFCYSPTVMKATSTSPTNTESVFPITIMTPVPSPQSTFNPRYSDIIPPSVDSYSCINFGGMEIVEHKLFNRSSVFVVSNCTMKRNSTNM